MDTTNKKKGSYKKNETKDIYERFKEELKRNNIDRTYYAREVLNISKSKLDHDKADCFTPSDIREMCKRFNCSVAYMFCETNSRNHEDLDIGVVTGLSEESVDYLRQLKENKEIEKTFLIDFLIKIVAEMNSENAKMTPMRSEKLTPVFLVNEMSRYNFCEQNKWFKRFKAYRNKDVKALKKFVVEEILDIYDDLPVRIKDTLLEIEHDTEILLNEFTRYINKAIHDLLKERNVFLAAYFESLYRGPLGVLGYPEENITVGNITYSKQQYEKLAKEKIKSIHLDFGPSTEEEEIINRILEIDRESINIIKEERAKLIDNLMEEYKDYQIIDDVLDSVDSDDEW